MSDEETNAAFTETETTTLKSLAKPQTASALERAAQLVNDYRAFGRLGGFLGSVFKWLIVAAAGIALLKSGTLSFLGLPG